MKKTTAVELQDAEGRLARISGCPTPRRLYRAPDPRPPFESPQSRFRLHLTPDPMTAPSTEIRIVPSGEEPGAKSIKVEIPVERVSAAEKQATSVLAKRVRLPGFRAGKAPVEVVRKRYRDAIREQLLRQLIDESWKAALEQEK